MEKNPIRVAIVGCGAVSERFHGPALRGFDGFAPVVMVDLDAKRAERLRNYFPSAAIDSDFRTLRGRADAAIVALPNYLNASAARHLLEDGISVLIEKPCAMTVEAAAELQLAASKSGAKVAIGFIRREAVGVRMARECIANGMLGNIQCFSVEDGYPFSWEAVNEFRFDSTRGGGILLDIGSHVLDMLRFWFGDIKIKRYVDDFRGGVETNCYIEVETDLGVTGTVELSWNRLLRNTAKVVGTRATLEVQWYTNSAHLMTSTGLQSLQGSIVGDDASNGGAQTFPEMFLAQLRRWYASLRNDVDGAAGLADFLDGRFNIELIAACREIRTNIIQPWRDGVWSA
jgi:predicted dehydrogenase